MNNINGVKLQKMIIEGALAIEDIKEKANELNVFPVPDGDTGTNMSLTMSAAIKALENLENPTLKEVSEKTASSLLRGARGNSGVILSLLFRGFSKHLKEIDEACGADLAIAFKDGVDTAYSAVMKPAEGTILTVARVSADSVLEFIKENPFATVEDTFEVYLSRLDEALAETQFQNKVLEKAGVVDAGAYGYIEIIRAMYNSFIGKEITHKEREVKSENTVSIVNEADIKFAYCTEFIANKEDKRRSVTKLQSVLDSIGDSIVIVEDDEIVKVHVHTNEPNIALGEGLKFGELSSIKIENMREQHSTKVIEEAMKYSKTMEIAENEKPYGFVAIAAGDGLFNVFSDLGADTVVSGGQTMNPSTDDIVRAVNSVPAETVFVLPNNKNIIMAAEQAKNIVETKNVIVIPSKTIPEGITAMLNFDESANVDENTTLLVDSLKAVKSAQVTYAARDSEFDGNSIKKGEYLGLLGGKLKSNSKKLDSVVQKLSKEMIDKTSSFVTIIYGEHTTEEDALEISQAFKKQNENVEITIINGGQPVYYYIISVE